MASEVEICNMALAHLRAGSINALNESSVQAQNCNLFYETARDQVLTESNWGFNNKITALAELSTVTIFNWSHIWQYPSDCLYINRLIRNYEEFTAGNSVSPPSRVYDRGISEPGQIPAVIYKLFNEGGTRVIATREDELRISYRERVTDPNLMPVNVRIAISYLLAAYVAIPIAGVKDGRSLRDDSLEDYTAFKSKAEDDNNNQEQFDVPESDYITVRN